MTNGVNTLIFLTIMQNILVCFFFYCAALSVVEEAASDEKKGKLYKPKSRVLETKSFLPLDTPPQFLAVDKRNVSVFIFKPKNVFKFAFFTAHYSLSRHQRREKRKRKRATLSSSKKN